MRTPKKTAAQAVISHVRGKKGAELRELEAAYRRGLDSYCNAAIDERRRRAAALPLADAVDRVASANGDLSGGGHGAVRRALAQLPERQRLIIFLRYYADLDYRTIGEALGITTGAIGATLSSSRRRARSSSSLAGGESFRSSRVDGTLALGA
jgi:hypothetical protein